MEVLVFQLLLAVVFGVICSAIASSRGRSGIAWFFIGIFAGCIGLIIVLCLPNLKEEQAKHMQLRLENRHLRERQRKDRQTADQRQTQTGHWLGLPAQALDLYTSRQVEGRASRGHLEHTGKPPPPPRNSPRSKRPSKLKNPEKVWFYEDQNSLEQGPVSQGRLKLFLKNNEITLTTQVWREPWTQWRVLSDVEELNLG